jgi:hypothetical protein
MATIKELLPYLEQGYIATDMVRIGPAYLHPKKQDDILVFEWTAYEMESEWSGPEIHTREYVLTWRSDNWGILCHTKPATPQGGTSEYDEDDPEKIKQAIADGLAYKAEGFRSE